MNEEPSFGGIRDTSTIDAQGRLPEAALIQGVGVRELANVLMENGSLTEIFRDDWQPGTVARHVFQRLLPPGKVSAWHAHAATMDRLFCGYGTVRITLYDGRAESPTHGRANIFRTGRERPQLITVPPGVWHAVVNIGATDALLINAASRPYDHAQPDHWRLAPESGEIPVEP
jgi:dTDP-4-dehydrorhamnose 3,5-epimerase